MSSYLFYSACKRGSPQYLTGASQNEDEAVNNCQTASSCTSNYECTSIGSMQLCCPTVASICSNAGGRPVDLLRTTNFDPGLSMKKSFSLSYATSSRLVRPLFPSYPPLGTTTTPSRAAASPSPTTAPLETTTTSSRPPSANSSVPNFNANTELPSRLEPVQLPLCLPLMFSSSSQPEVLNQCRLSQHPRVPE